VKITDVDGRHPITGLPLMRSCDDEDYNEENTMQCIQYRKLCAILVMADAKDSTALYYDAFRDFYDFSERLRQFGMPASDGEPALQPFIVSHLQDMKSAQIVARKGGCCKIKEYFCHLCSCTKHKLTSLNVGNLRCDRCKRRDKKNAIITMCATLCSLQLCFKIWKLSLESTQISTRRNLMPFHAAPSF
jgi:hypothetical protein